MKAELKALTMPGGWTAAIYQKWEFPPEVIEAWDGIARSYGDMGIFISYGWFASWWQAFGSNEKLFVVVLLKDGQTKAIFPCCLKTGTSDGLRGEYISSLTNDHTCYYDFIIDPAVRPAVLSHFIHSLKKIYPDAQMYFEYMPTSNENATLLLTELNINRMPVHKYSEAWAPWTEVPGNITSFYAELPGRLRNTLRRCRKTAEAKGRLDFEVIEKIKQLDDILDVLFEIEYNSWKGKNGTAIKCQKEVEYFYRLLAHWAMKCNHLVLFFLRLNNEPIAASFCLHSGQTIFLLKPGYHESFAHLSPGNLLQYEILKNLTKWPQIKEYNFLGACDPWKLEWTRNSRAMGFVRAYPNSFRGWSDYTFKYGWKNVLGRFHAVQMLKAWIGKEKNQNHAA